MEITFFTYLLTLSVWEGMVYSALSLEGVLGCFVSFLILCDGFFLVVALCEGFALVGCLVGASLVGGGVLSSAVEY